MEHWFCMTGVGSEMKNSWVNLKNIMSVFTHISMMSVAVAAFTKSVAAYVRGVVRSQRMLYKADECTQPIS